MIVNDLLSKIALANGLENSGGALHISCFRAVVASEKAGTGFDSSRCSKSLLREVTTRSKAISNRVLS